MPGNPKECREHAKCCLEMAVNATGALERARFERLAQTWMRLATDLEAVEGLVERWGEPEAKRYG